jgi:ABC transporter substrate binding protein
MFFQERKRIAQLAARARLAAVYGFREYVDAGGLISYGVNLADNFRRAATYVVKILKGAKPGDLAVEFPNKLELIINLKTSKALGGRPILANVRFAPEAAHARRRVRPRRIGSCVGRPAQKPDADVQGRPVVGRVVFGATGRRRYPRFFACIARALEDPEQNVRLAAPCDRASRYHDREGPNLGDPICES